jgi:hypothetical protein
MAITLTRTVQRVETYPAAQAEEGETTYPTLMVVYNDVFDDPDDEQLPVTATKVMHFSQGDDVSGEDQLVQDIADALWS